MDIRFKNYRRRKFQDWKQRVRSRLPEMAVHFYLTKINGKYIPADKEKLLGFVIQNINNPSYSITTSNGKRADEMEEMGAEVMLEIMVSELFAFVNKDLKFSLFSNSPLIGSE